jgi:Tol biopolymer transport system component
VLTDVDNYEDLERSWISVSKTDTAVYAPGNPARRSLVWVDREGHIQTISKEQAEYREVRIAPGGSTAVVKQGYDLWTYDFQQGTRTRLTFHENTQEDASSPVWSRDGTRVIFASNGEGNWDIYSQPADGSRPPEVLLKRPYDKFPVSATRDGTVLFNEANPTTGEDLWALAPDGRASPYRVTPFNESNGDISPDGRWIAYDSDESGRSEVYIQAYPGGGKRFVISSGGGYMPRWSDEGKEVFYFSGDALMVATVSSDGSVAGVRRLFDRSGFLVRYTSYDVSPDGRRLLMIHRDPGSVPSQLNVVLNWSEELQRLVTPGRK